MGNNVLIVIIISGFVLLSYKYFKYDSQLVYLFGLIFLFYLMIENSTFHVNFFDFSYWKILVLIILSICFSIIVIINTEKTFEVSILMFLVFSGAFIMITCDNLLVIYLGLELQTFSLFILISKNRTSVKSSEAGLKYFILGALSSGFYLIGIFFLFLGGSTLCLKDLMVLFDEVFTIIGLVFILLSFIFKLGLSPLHFWVPDVYEGSSWNTLGLILTLPKISALVVLIQLGYNSNLLLSCSLLSVIIGTLGALNQSKMKRLLAYSGISHVGFIFLGANICSYGSYEIVFTYLMIYILTMLSILIMIINSFWNKNCYIIELVGDQYVNKIVTFSWLILFLSIGGLPPLSGFISKWFILWGLIESNYNLVSFVLVFFSAVGLGYYLRIVKISYFQQRSSYITWRKVLKYRHTNNDFQYNVLGVLIFLTLFLVLNINPLILVINTSFIHCY